MGPEELFEVTGELQGVANALEGAQLVAIAHAGAHETRLTERGPVQVHHDLGFIDAMTSSEVSLATGLGQWVAGRKVGLAAALASRFPRLLGKVLTGELATVNASKVVTACDGLDDTACAAVEAVLADRLVGIDPARVTTVARRSPPGRRRPGRRRHAQEQEGPVRAGHPRPGRHHRLVGPPPGRALGRRLGRDPRPRRAVRRQGRSR